MAKGWSNITGVTEKKRLLVTTSTFPRWENDATPPFIFELSKRLVKEYDVYVLAPYSHGSREYEERDGLHIYRYKFFPSKKLFSDGAIVPFLRKNKIYYFQVPSFFIMQFLAVRKLVKKYKIDAIHAHWIIPQGLVAVLYKKLFNRKIKIAMTSLGADIFGLRSSPLIRLKKWALNNSSGLTVMTKAIVELVYEIGYKRELPIEVIPMGADLSKCDPKNIDASIRDKYRIKGAFLLVVARLSEKKGVKYMIEAMPRILKAFPDAKLLIIGDGEEKDSLHSLTKVHGLFEKSVHFLGAVAHADLPKYYATCDILIGPSVVAGGGDSDGLPVVFVEALCSGCALITTDLPTLKDIVTDGETGLIVRQKDSAHIAERVIELLKNDELKNKIKENGRRFVLNNFDWDVIADKYLSFLNKCFKWQ